MLEVVFLNDLGKKIRNLRLKFNLTQEELAAKLNLSRDAVIRLEKGERKLSLNEFNLLASIFNISMDDFALINENNDEIKGIILAGGSGTRLYPITEGISKQMVPVYDKPMIYYPLSVLLSAGIKDILIITTKEDQNGFIRMLGDGSKFGINLSYTVQPSPDGLAQAFILGKEFIGDKPCAMVLGDNIFFGNGLEKELNKAKMNAFLGKATIFGYQVKDPERFGIMELDDNNNVIGVEEKPENPKSDYAITGLYFYPKGVSKMAEMVKPSKRGELEITTLNDMYLQESRLKASLLSSGYTWFDTGTFDSLLDASNMIKSIEDNQDRLICSPEVISYKNGWLTLDELNNRAELMKKNNYGKKLIKIVRKEMNNEKVRN